MKDCLSRHKGHLKVKSLNLIYLKLYILNIAHYIKWHSSGLASHWVPPAPGGQAHPQQEPPQLLRRGGAARLQSSASGSRDRTKVRYHLTKQNKTKWILWKSKFSALTRCSRVASFHTTTLTATGWAPTTTKSQSTAPTEQKLGDFTILLLWILILMILETTRGTDLWQSLTTRLEHRTIFQTLSVAQLTTGE